MSLVLHLMTIKYFNHITFRAGIKVEIAWVTVRREQMWFDLTFVPFLWPNVKYYILHLFSIIYYNVFYVINVQLCHIRNLIKKSPSSEINTSKRIIMRNFVWTLNLNGCKLILTWQCPMWYTNEASCGLIVRCM